MSSEVHYRALGEITDWFSGGTPSKKVEDYWNGDIPWISASSMGGVRYSDSDLKITEAGLRAGSRLAPKGSILLLVRGSALHKNILVGITERDVAFNQDVKAIRVKEHLIAERYVDEAYIYYWLRANKQKLLEMVEHTGIGAGKLDTKRLQNIEVRLPSWNEQRKIVATATALDEKEILNSKFNQTLEQIAQAIFKSWFVDFEPVKAKINALAAGGSEEDALLAAMQAISGKDKAQLTQLQTDNPEHYNQLRTTAELFPCAMQDSELGEIPEGWSCLALDEIAKYQNGLALQKFRPKDEEEWLPVVKIAQLKKGFADGKERAVATIKPDCIIENGDVVFSWSGSLMIDTWCGGRAALNQHLFKVTSQDYPKWLFFHFTRHHLEEFQRIAADKAVTMGHIKREHLKQALCAVPDTKLLNAVGITLGTMLEKQINLRLESDSLKQIRDTLLPRLLSGDLNFSETSEEFSNEQFHEELS